VKKFAIFLLSLSLIALIGCGSPIEDNSKAKRAEQAANTEKAMSDAGE
jgi:hypothetical protein